MWKISRIMAGSPEARAKDSMRERMDKGRYSPAGRKLPSLGGQPQGRGHPTQPQAPQGRQVPPIRSSVEVSALRGLGRWWFVGPVWVDTPGWINSALRAG